MSAFSDLQSISRILLEQLKKSQVELTLELKEIGDCDHSVNMCSCELIRLLEDNQAVITQAEGTL